MSTLTKVFVVLTTVTAIVLSCLTVASAAQWGNTRELIAKYQLLYDAELMNRRNAQAELAAVTALKDDALRARDQALSQKDAELRRLSDDVAQVRSDLARETNDKVSAEAGRKKLEEILDVQMAELTGTQKQNQDLVAQNIDLQTRNQRMASRLLEVTGDLTIASDQVRNLQEKLYASEQQFKQMQQGQAAGPSAAATPAAPDSVIAVTPSAAGPIRGEVTNVDGRYVSINVGESSGVVEGMTFMIYRSGTYIGDVQIETVRPKESGGKVTMLAPGQQVASGDSAAYGLETQ